MSPSYAELNAENRALREEITALKADNAEKEESLEEADQLHRKHVDTTEAIVAELSNDIADLEAAHEHKEIQMRRAYERRLDDKDLELHSVRRVAKKAQLEAEQAMEKLQAKHNADMETLKADMDRLALKKTGDEELPRKRQRKFKQWAPNGRVAQISKG